MKQPKYQNKDYQEFSFFQFFIKIFVIASCLLSVLIIIDFFLPEVNKVGEFLYFQKNNAVISYGFNDRANINLSEKENYNLKSEDEIIIKLTPIFKNRKSYSFTDNNGNYFEGESMPLLLPIFTIVFNFVALFFFVLYPDVNDKMLRKLDIKLSDLFLSDYPYTFLGYLQYVFIIPFVLSLVYWYKLIIYFYN